MRRGLLCVAMAVLALVLPGTAAARPFTDLTSLTPQNRKGQVLKQVRRTRPVTIVVGFRVTNAPRSAGYRLRVSLTLTGHGERLRVRSSSTPAIYTGMYRFSMPLEVPAGYAVGQYRLFGQIQVLDGSRIVAGDHRARGLRVR